jgi:hypothetical protein
MESHGTLWNLTEPHEIPQNLMESHGRFWNFADYSGCLQMITNDDITQCI